MGEGFVTERVLMDSKAAVWFYGVIFWALVGADQRCICGTWIVLFLMACMLTR